MGISILPTADIGQLYTGYRFLMNHLFLILIVLPAALRADDAFVCCMGGWKEIHGTVLCQAPCCPGYNERVEKPPLLSPLVYCRKSGYEEVSVSPGMFKLGNLYR